jgi:hypothetical protein
VILLEIYPKGVAIFEFERDTPWSIHMDRVSHRFEAPQRMEIKARNVHFFRPHGDVQAIQAAQDARMHLRVDLPGPPLLPKLGESLAFEAPDHNPAM